MKSLNSLHLITRLVIGFAAIFILTFLFVLFEAVFVGSNSDYYVGYLTNPLFLAMTSMLVWPVLFYNKNAILFCILACLTAGLWATMILFALIGMAASFATGGLPFHDYIPALLPLFSIVIVILLVKRSSVQSTLPLNPFIVCGSYIPIWFFSMFPVLLVLLN